MDKNTLRTLLNVAKGNTTPDTIIRNGKIVNVFTNAIEKNLSIIIKDGWIVSVEDDKNVDTYKDANIIDAEGLYLCPGFMDSHTHIDGMYPFYELVPCSIKGGTTTIITECTMVACGCGKEGVDSFIESTKGYPLRCYFVAPTVTPPFPKMEGAIGLNFKEFSVMLKREDVLGAGEAYWTRAVEGEDRILKQASLTMSLRKVLDGHAAGAKNKRLIQYLLTGITSCHESTNLEEAIEKLRFGVYVQIREGFVRQELKELSKLKDVDVDKRRLILVSDFFDGVMLYEDGYMDYVVRMAIEYGFSPMDAIKMATINPADYLGLRYLGAIAPLRYADILFLKDIQDISIKKVMVNGEIVFSDSSFIKPIKPFHYPKTMKHTVTTRKFKEEDFKIKAQRNKNHIRVIDIANETITKEFVHKAEVKDGYLQVDLANDIIPISVINRITGRYGKGFLRGTGIKNGALATTYMWDSANILVFGSSEKDMEVAVNRLIELQGGFVISKDGKVIHEFPMPLYGTMPDLTMKEISEKTKGNDRAMKEIGCILNKPFLTIQTFSFTGLPLLRITDKGLADVKNKRLVSVFVE